jgi:hypothetical protein
VGEREESGDAPPVLLGHVEIAHLVVHRRAEPHAALRVREEVAHRVFGARVRIFHHLAALRIEPADDVHVFGRVAHHVVAIDAERIGRVLRSRKLELGDGAGLGVEAPDFADVEFRESHAPREMAQVRRLTGRSWDGGDVEELPRYGRGSLRGG